MFNLINKLVKDESGQDLAEYAIALGVIAVGAIAAVSLLGTNVAAALNAAAGAILPPAA